MEALLGIVDSLEMNELHRAVQENRLEAVKYLVKKGAVITNTINGGATPLHIAVSLDRHQMVQELLKLKPRDKLRNAINGRTEDTGTGALHLAARNNLLETTRFLLGCGANWDIRDNDNRRPELSASDEGIHELLASIREVFDLIPTGDSQAISDKLSSCSAGSLTALCYARDSHDHTSLQGAMERYDLDEVATIVNFRIDKLKQSGWQAGAEIDVLMQHSKAARLSLSNLGGFYYEVDELMVDTYIKNEVLDVLRFSSDLLKACKERVDPSLVDQPLLVIIEESLEFFGSREESRFVENDSVVLLLRKDLEHVILMLKLCIIAPMQLFMKAVYSAELLDAAKRNDLARVEKCLTGHPDLNARDDDKDWTALHYAVDNLYSRMIALLLDHGADPASESKRSMPPETPLHLAASKKEPRIQVDVVRRLLDHVDSEKLVDYINLPTPKDRSTALHLAVELYDSRFAELLLSKGSIYCAENANKSTPLSLHGRAYELLVSIDRSFYEARNGKVEEIIQRMKGLHYKNGQLLAFGGARNDEGHTLDQVLDLGGHADGADKIRKLLANAKRWI